MTTTASTESTTSALPERPGEYVLDGVIVVVNGLHKVHWRSDCDFCVRMGRGPIVPSHEPPVASHTLHCTCGRCF